MQFVETGVLRMLEIIKMLSEILFCAGYVSHTNSFPPPLSGEEEQKYVRLMREGDEQARQKLITHNLRLVAHIARKYVRAGRDCDDIVSIGTVGLIKAVTTFDPDKGTSLSSYAGRCVENEILMSIRAEKKQIAGVSLTDPIGTDSDGNDVTLSDILGTDADMVTDVVFSLLDATRLQEAIARVLVPRERVVIRMRYGLRGGNCFTQQQIASYLGISRSYVSRIEKKALEKLMEALTVRET